MFSKCIWCSSNACCRVTNLSCSFCRVSIRSGRKVSALQNLAVYVSQTLNSQKTKRSQGQSAVSARVVKKSTRSYEKSPTMETRWLGRMKKDLNSIQKVSKKRNGGVSVLKVRAWIVNFWPAELRETKSISLRADLNIRVIVMIIQNKVFYEIRQTVIITRTTSSSLALEFKKLKKNYSSGHSNGTNSDSKSLYLQWKSSEVNKFETLAKSAADKIQGSQLCNTSWKEPFTG